MFDRERFGFCLLVFTGAGGIIFLVGLPAGAVVVDVDVFRIDIELELLFTISPDT